MAHPQQGGDQPERSYVSSMFDDDSRYSGNLFVDTNKVTPMKSLWPVPGTKLKQFDSVLRVMPGKRNDGEWSKFRTGTGKGEYGRWIYSAWAARAIGEPAITFFLCTDQDVQEKGYDPRQHPVYILYNSIYWAVDEGNQHVKAHWAPMITSKQRKVIKKPGPMFLVQCMAYGRGDKVYEPPMGADDGEKIIVFDLASDGGKSLRTLLDTRKSRDDEDQPHEGSSFADYYKYGDITAFDGGKFVQIFPAGHNPNRDAGPPPMQGPRRSLSRASVNEGRSRAQKAMDDEKEKIGYEVAILDEYEGWRPEIEADLASALADKIYPWPDIIKTPDHKTAAEYLWSRMRFGGELKLDVLLYAWQDHPDWLPSKDSDVWGEWVARKQVAPGYDPTAGADDDGNVPDGPARDSGVDRRTRHRAGDGAERADDQPRPLRKAGAPAQAPVDDAEPPPQRASRMIDRQEAVEQGEPSQSPQPPKGNVSVARDRGRPAEAVAGGGAATDVAATPGFRPSAAAADEGSGAVVDKAGGFAEPPAAKPAQPPAPASGCRRRTSWRRPGPSSTSDVIMQPGGRAYAARPAVVWRLIMVKKAAPRRRRRRPSPRPRPRRRPGPRASRRPRSRRRRSRSATRPAPGSRPTTRT